MRYKKLTKEQIIISIDRLTRFKNTQEKYFRVFSDIIISNLIEPKLKKKDLESIDFTILTQYATEIFNNSLENNNHCYQVNEILKVYENEIFNNNEDTQLLLDNCIDYISAVSLIPENCPVNLKWLKELVKITQNSEISYDSLINIRGKNLLKYPIEEVILVEGITEEILLPAFSKFLGYDFYAKGIQVIPAGGKNQVVKMYYKLAEELKIPIFVLLDKDAEENINEIRPRLRGIDKIHLVASGEFEDLLPKSLIINTVNSHFKNFLAITEKDLDLGLPTANILEDLFKTKGLHEFKKAEFAKLVRENISLQSDISDEIRDIIKEISTY